MDAKDLTKEAALGDRNDGAASYTQSGGAVEPCSRPKTYQDMGSSPMAKAEVAASRPCAVIGPDRVVPPADAYLRKPPEPWPTDPYRRPPDYPLKLHDYQHPTRNISPRQTFQENMQRIMVPPTYATNKLKEDCFQLESNISPLRNKVNVSTETKFCDVPYAVNPIVNDPKNVRTSDVSVHNNNSVLTRSASQAWSPVGAQVRPSKTYSSTELYQYPDYTSCAAPRPMYMPLPHRSVLEESGHLVDPYGHNGNIRFKPYPTPTMKDRYLQPRYDYINNYPNPVQAQPVAFSHHKTIPTNTNPGYSQVPLKYMDSRLSDPLINSYQRPANPQTTYNNIAYRNQVIHPSYGTIQGSCLQPNKFYPYPDTSAKAMAAKLPPYPDFEGNRPKPYPVPDGYYINDVARSHSMKAQVMSPNYPTPNLHMMHPHPYYRKDSLPIKSFDHGGHYRNIDQSINMNANALPKFTSQFPNAVAISSDSMTHNPTNMTPQTYQEDFSYVTQSPSVGTRGLDPTISRFANDPFRRYEYNYGPVHKPPPVQSKCEPYPVSDESSKDKKDLDVRKFLEMWNEGEEESSENNTKNNSKTFPLNTVSPGTHVSTNTGDTGNQEQLYVMGIVNVPREELDKYEHIQKVSKLPENIKGYNSIEILHKFEEVIESSNLNDHKSPPSSSRDFRLPPKNSASFQQPPKNSLPFQLPPKNSVPYQPPPKNSVPFQTPLQNSVPFQSMQVVMPRRPLSPLDVESKISQSVIHKEVGCNFEIKPCSPKMLNAERATPVQNIMSERIIEKVSNPVGTPPSSNKTPVENPDVTIAPISQDQTISLMEQNIKSPCCKMAGTQYSKSDIDVITKPNYTLQDLESNSGVCLASLPRLDNDIELSFPEVNQQFINANKMESVVSSKPVQDLDRPLKDVVEKLQDKQSQTQSKNDQQHPKLNKYRKIKRKSNDSIDKSCESSKQVIRTDSVIIKNPDTNKIFEDISAKFPKCKADAAPQRDPINLTKHTDYFASVEESMAAIHNEIHNASDDSAIDFSLSSNDRYHGYHQPNLFSIDNQNNSSEFQLSLERKNDIISNPKNDLGGELSSPKFNDKSKSGNNFQNKETSTSFTCANIALANLKKSQSQKKISCSQTEVLKKTINNEKKIKMTENTEPNKESMTLLKTLTEDYQDKSVVLPRTDEMVTGLNQADSSNQIDNTMSMSDNVELSTMPETKKAVGEEDMKKAVSVEVAAKEPARAAKEIKKSAGEETSMQQLRCHKTNETSSQPTFKADMEVKIIDSSSDTMPSLTVIECDIEHSTSSIEKSEFTECFKTVYKQKDEEDEIQNQGTSSDPIAIGEDNMLINSPSIFFDSPLTPLNVTPENSMNYDDVIKSSDTESPVENTTIYSPFTSNSAHFTENNAHFTQNDVHFAKNDTHFKSVSSFNKEMFSPWIRKLILREDEGFKTDKKKGLTELEDHTSDCERENITYFEPDHISGSEPGKNPDCEPNNISDSKPDNISDRESENVSDCPKNNLGNISFRHDAIDVSKNCETVNKSTGILNSNQEESESDSHVGAELNVNQLTTVLETKLLNSEDSTMSCDSEFMTDKNVVENLCYLQSRLPKEIIDLSESEEPDKIIDLSEFEETEKYNKLSESEDNSDLSESEQPENVSYLSEHEQPENVSDSSEYEQPEKITEFSEYEHPENITDVNECEQSEDVTDLNESVHPQKITDLSETEQTKHITHLNECVHSKNISDLSEFGYPEKITDLSELGELEIITKLFKSREPEMITVSSESQESKNITDFNESEEPKNITDVNESGKVTNFSESLEPKEITDNSESAKFTVIKDSEQPEKIPGLSESGNFTKDAVQKSYSTTIKLNQYEENKHSGIILTPDYDYSDINQTKFLNEDSNDSVLGTFETPPNTADENKFINAAGEYKMLCGRNRINKEKYFIENDVTILQEDHRSDIKTHDITKTHYYKSLTLLHSGNSSFVDDTNYELVNKLTTQKTSEESSKDEYVSDKDESISHSEIAKNQVQSGSQINIKQAVNGEDIIGESKMNDVQKNYENKINYVQSDKENGLDEEDIVCKTDEVPSIKEIKVNEGVIDGNNIVYENEADEAPSIKDQELDGGKEMDDENIVSGNSTNEALIIKEQDFNKEKRIVERNVVSENINDEFLTIDDEVRVINNETTDNLSEFDDGKSEGHHREHNKTVIEEIKTDASFKYMGEGGEKGLVAGNTVEEKNICQEKSTDDNKVEKTCISKIVEDSKIIMPDLSHESMPSKLYARLPHAVKKVPENCLDAIKNLYSSDTSDLEESFSENEVDRLKHDYASESESEQEYSDWQVDDEKTRILHLKKTVAIVSSDQSEVPEIKHKDDLTPKVTECSDIDSYDEEYIDEEHVDEIYNSDCIWKLESQEEKQNVGKSSPFANRYDILTMRNPDKDEIFQNIVDSKNNRSEFSFIHLDVYKKDEILSFTRCIEANDILSMRNPEKNEAFQNAVDPENNSSNVLSVDLGVFKNVNDNITSFTRDLEALTKNPEKDKTFRNSFDSENDRNKVLCKDFDVYNKTDANSANLSFDIDVPTMSNPEKNKNFLTIVEPKNYSSDVVPTGLHEPKKGSENITNFTRDIENLTMRNPEKVKIIQNVDSENYSKVLSLDLGVSKNEKRNNASFIRDIEVLAMKTPEVDEILQNNVDSKNNRSKCVTTDMEVAKKIEHGTDDIHDIEMLTMSIPEKDKILKNNVDSKINSSKVVSIDFDVSKKDEYSDTLTRDIEVVDSSSKINDDYHHIDFTIDSTTTVEVLKENSESTVDNDYQEPLDTTNIDVIEEPNDICVIDHSASVPKKSLKRSFSDSDLFNFKDDQDIILTRKRTRCNPLNNKLFHKLSNSCGNSIQNSRRNSLSSVSNETRVSFCILIDNDCLIPDCSDSDNLQCIAEIAEDCITCVQSDPIVGGIDSSAEIVSFVEEMNEYSNNFGEDGTEESHTDDSWVHDVACVETVVSDDIAEDIVISASTPTSELSNSEYDEEADVNINDHTEKVKFIYGDTMCNNDAHLLETLYRTPQMNVNKHLMNKESQNTDNCNAIYDRDALENALSEPSGYPEVVYEPESVAFNTSSLYFPDLDVLGNDRENMDLVTFNSPVSPFNGKDTNKPGKIDQTKVSGDDDNDKTQDHTVHSCESSTDNVFSYDQNGVTPKCIISSSPEVSSTTSEEKNSSILLKITNLRAAKVSHAPVESQNRISCKYTETNDYLRTDSKVPARPLITKAAQKYIPPLKETIPNLKVKLTLPQPSLLRLKQMKISKESHTLSIKVENKPNVSQIENRPNVVNIENRPNVVNIENKPNVAKNKDIPKKLKPKFEDVLKNIEEIQFQMHKEKSKKTKKSIPRVVIKKNGNGSHYASTSNELPAPDLTGRKWQPWVFLEKSHFIDKMARTGQMRAIFNRRRNRFILADKFKKYKSVASSKFVISKPKIENYSSGRLKYTIRLKHGY